MLTWYIYVISFIGTLVLGLRPRQGHRKVQAESVTRESHLHSWSVRECEGMNPHIPKWIPILGMESLWSLEFKKNDFKD
jgi:hypothetical protein